MTTDPIIEELHRIREELAAQYNYDVFALGAALQAWEKQTDRPVVSYEVKHTNKAETVTEEMLERAA